MKESDFHRELIGDMRAQGVKLAKIPDAPASYVMGKAGQKFRFSPPKFVDLVGVGPCERVTPVHVLITPFGRPLIWEAKMMKKLAAWPLKSLRDDQLKILLDFSELADARVIINYRVKTFTKNQVVKYGLSHLVDRKRLNLITCLFPEQVLDAYQRGWKSIPMSVVAPHVISRPWGGSWDYWELRNCRLTLPLG